MILGDPEAFWVAIERMGIKPGDARYPDDVVAAYRAQFADPATVEAMCEDYRAGATIDRALDDADRGTTDDRLPDPRAVGRRGRAAALLRGPAGAVARRTRRRSTGRAIEGASHFLVEDAPGEVADDLAGFFAAG